MTEECAHNWVSGGLDSDWICTECGERRDMANEEEGFWDPDRSLLIACRHYSYVGEFCPECNPSIPAETPEWRARFDLELNYLKNHTDRGMLSRSRVFKCPDHNCWEVEVWR